MTHYTVGIIIPEDHLPHLDSFVEAQMTPYDENTRVAPYVCYSVEQARAEIERDIHRLSRIVEGRDAAYNLEKCREHLEALRATTPEAKYAEYVRIHEHFNHRGEPVSTDNPNSKWDWYVVGGRWDGWITGNEQSSDGGYNFGLQHQTVANNIAPTSRALERDVITHAIVTPDGHWHERGQLGWWAALITENEHWDAQAREILAAYPGCQLLILDAHI
jgi:hypothetical protein